MPKLLLHPYTETAIKQFLAAPTHAALIVGPKGSGKLAIAQSVAAGLLGVSIEELSKYPHLHHVSSIEQKAIPIETIRELQGHMTLKIPGGNRAVSRVALIEDAHLMTTESQNALLKTLEEPPEGTVLILTAPGTASLLPTIQSRVRAVTITTPSLQDLTDYFIRQGHDAEAVQKAIMVSGGLPGLTHSLLTSPEEHALYAATIEARKLLQASAYDRLAMVDGLSKQKPLIMDILFILGQMARMALVRNPAMPAPASKRWRNILEAAFQAQEALQHNAQTKLVLTNLMLEL